MRNSLLLFLAIFCSCTVPMRELHTDCASNTEDVFRTLAVTLTQEGYALKLNDPKAGTLVGETGYIAEEQYSTPTKFVWSIIKNGNGLRASCKTFVRSAQQQYTQYGGGTTESEAYIDDSYFRGETRYWKIRNAIEELCRGNIIWTEKESK